MRECGCYSTTTLAQPRRPCRPRHPYAVSRTLFQCVCTRRRNCIGQLSPSARSKRARRKVALHFWSQRHVLSTQWNFLSAGRAFDRDQRMLELWNNWYETLASMEELATVIVIVVLGAGVITVMEGRRR